MSKSKVAVLFTKPETVLDDYARLLEMAGAKEALDPAAPTILKDNISWHYPMPSANTTPWQLEGTILALKKNGFKSITCVQNKTEVTKAEMGEGLNNFTPVFNAHDIELFKDALAPDLTFYFDPNNVGDWVGDYEIPEFWGYDDLTSAVENMFDQAYSISFSIVTTGVGDPDEGATEYVAYNVYIDILVMVDSQNGYMASGPCDFGFENSGYGRYDDWVVTDWWDNTAYGRAEEPLSPASLGIILAVFK